MELPFAVVDGGRAAAAAAVRPLSPSSCCSLVTASSQGSSSFLHTTTAAAADDYDPYPPKQIYSKHHHADDDDDESGFADVLSQFGVVTSSPPRIQQEPNHQQEETMIDFTYVNVCETDEDEVDIILAAAGGAGTEQAEEPQRGAGGDVLSLILGSNGGSNKIISLIETANRQSEQAAQAKQQGNLQQALDTHTAAAKGFREAALGLREQNASMANTLLLLSQTQAKSALALKRVVRLLLPNNNNLNDMIQNNQAIHSSGSRLRATVRGALDKSREADISDSAFLGRAKSNDALSAAAASPHPFDEESTTTTADNNNNKKNPVDEMMQLERELRDMDMALEMGNSISSLGDAAATACAAMNGGGRRGGGVDGSFMVVPGSNSYYMSSSGLISPPPASSRPPQVGINTARARANRVQTARPPPPPPPPNHAAAAATTTRNQSLESSWWGNASSTAASSHVLASSVISIASGASAADDLLLGNSTTQTSQQSTNTKQLMRLMDALKTLGDENAALLRQVEGAEAARLQATAAKEQMKRFKEDYGKRFAALKEALEKFRKGYPNNNNNGASNPVVSSEFVKTACATDQLQRQEQLIAKLTADLQKEKEMSRKKDAALRKYESFYREVKARSAQKAAQRQKEQQKQQQQQQHR